VWFNPSEVWEIRAAQLTVSSLYKACSGVTDIELSKGLALRFPRFVQQRPDKLVTQASFSTDLAELYQRSLNSNKK